MHLSSLRYMYVCVCVCVCVHIYGTNSRSICMIVATCMKQRLSSLRYVYEYVCVCVYVCVHTYESDSFNLRDCCYML